MDEKAVHTHSDRRRGQQYQTAQFCIWFYASWGCQKELPGEVSGGMEHTLRVAVEADSICGSTDSSTDLTLELIGLCINKTSRDYLCLTGGNDPIVNQIWVVDRELASRGSVSGVLGGKFQCERAAHRKLPSPNERPEKLVPRRAVDRTTPPFGSLSGEHGHKGAADLWYGVYLSIELFYFNTTRVLRLDTLQSGCGGSSLSAPGRGMGMVKTNGWFLQPGKGLKTRRPDVEVNSAYAITQLECILVINGKQQKR
ncbi:hypothetical protein H4582DRAFT_2057980 [Lactarius indigo]|nr:hypothetical protein H4582DRAFT_2057980 [Lactarius indigo]